MFKYIKEIILVYYKQLLIFFLLSLFLITFTGSILTLNFLSYNSKIMKNNIVEMNEEDIGVLCDIVKCISVESIKTNLFYKKDSKNILRVSAKPKSYKRYEIKENVFVNKNGFYIKTNNNFYKLNISYVEKKTLIFSFIIVVILFILYFIFLYKALISEKNKMSAVNATNEALLTAKSMFNITENLHHEMNSPIEVITNKVHKLNEIVVDYENTFDVNDLNEIKNDFGMVISASTEIQMVLDKMSKYKGVINSNSNETLYNIIDKANKTINLSNSNYNFFLDEKLKNFMLQTDKLSNPDFLHIIFNHIKNSVESNATKIYIILETYRRKELLIRVIDDGNGINKEKQEKLFESSLTVSSEKLTGLQLNKNILNYGEGDVKVIETSNHGTTFEIKVKAKVLKNDNCTL